MQYRKFGGLDWQASALGFGCMRLPTLGGKSEVDEPEAIRMIRYAIDHGVNYLDTAYGYHGGQSERVVGRALQGGYRERVRLATKLPPWECKSAADFDRLLNEQLGKLQTERVDFYLLHSLDAESWHKLLQMGILEWLERILADGRAGHVGFSFHDSLDVFKEIVDGYDRWTFCQIQYNYLNEEEQAGTAGLRYAAERGLAVVVMEPLLGGRLVNPPEPIARLWAEAPTLRTPAEWALQWLWNKPEVSVVLSGMSTFAQVTENLVSAGASGVGVLGAEEVALVGRVAEAYQALCPIPCTGCKYCLPCPSGVEIPQVFAIYNEGMMYHEEARSRRRYESLGAEKDASACVACRQCEERCPQRIPISEWMPIVHEVLAGGAEFGCRTP